MSYAMHNISTVSLNRWDIKKKLKHPGRFILASRQFAKCFVNLFFSIHFIDTISRQNLNIKYNSEQPKYYD